MTVGIGSFKVGAVRCRRFVHDRGRGDPAWMFPDISVPLLTERLRPYLDDGGRFGFVYSSLMVETGTDLVLLDTSLPAPNASEPSSIERALASVAVSPSEVDVVVITHGHLDHVGGLARSGAPVFAGARHVVSGDEIGHWTSADQPDGEAASIFRAVIESGLVDVVDGEREIVPGLRVFPTPGHTPGHLAVEIRSEGQTAIYVGDVLAHEVNVTEPEWNHFSDLEPSAAAASRRRLVDRAAGDRSIVVGSHLATTGRVTHGTAGGYAYRPDVRPSRHSDVVT